MEQVGGGHQQLGGDHLQLVVREIEHQQALALEQPFWDLSQQVVRQVKGGQLLRLEDGGGDGGMGEGVVPQVEGAQAGQLPHALPDGLHVVALHSEVFQLLKLSHLSGDCPQFCVVQFQPPEINPMATNFQYS